MTRVINSSTIEGFQPPQAFEQGFDLNRYLWNQQAEVCDMSRNAGAWPKEGSAGYCSPQQTGNYRLVKSDTDLDVDADSMLEVRDKIET